MPFLKTPRKNIPTDLCDHIPWLDWRGQPVSLAATIARHSERLIQPQELSLWLGEGSIEAIDVGGIRYVTRASLERYLYDRAEAQAAR